jgi:quinolinate synthase
MKTIMSKPMTEPAFHFRRAPETTVPPAYYQIPQDELTRRGFAAKRQLGDRVIVLAHHYQRDETYAFADVSGDSLYLSQQAAATPAEFIVFCGVHFMAECSDIITADHQLTMLPERSAGCSMADMADVAAVENCWQQLEAICGPDRFIPITYINSAATLKAFCGRHGGTVCTSSNAGMILRWALNQQRRVLFFPDQHLGRNTANQLGVPADQIVLWEREKTDGGLAPAAVEGAQVVLWSGYCSVHCRFTVAQIEAVRARRPGVRVIVHPECPAAVVEAADDFGSTDRIIRTITAAEPGSHWAVGTENNLVRRLARDLSSRDGKRIENLNPEGAICSTMISVHPAGVVWVLENLVEGNVVNPIQVDPPVKTEAALALKRMLDLSVTADT